MTSYHLDHLDHLETEAIHVLREVAAEFERPAILFSGGKDSICILRLAEKAFRPSEIPMPFLNVETGHEFPELIDFRDRRARELGAKLIVRTVDEGIAKGFVTPQPGQTSRNQLQIPVLLNAIEEFRFDCCIGGARRDEEKARAKERFFSFRDAFGQWDPKNQRPEIWNLYNARLNPGENMRVFPLSNWTEMDVWEYIRRERLAVPTIYFSHERECFRRAGQWLPVPPPHADESRPDPYAGARPRPTLASISGSGSWVSRPAWKRNLSADFSNRAVGARGERYHFRPWLLPAVSSAGASCSACGAGQASWTPGSPGWPLARFPRMPICWLPSGRGWISRRWPACWTARRPPIRPPGWRRGCWSCRR